MITVPFTKNQLDDFAWIVTMWVFFLGGSALIIFGVSQLDNSWNLISSIGYMGFGIILIAFPVNNFLNKRIQFKKVVEK